MPLQDRQGTFTLTQQGESSTCKGKKWTENSIITEYGFISLLVACISCIILVIVTSVVFSSKWHIYICSKSCPKSTIYLFSTVKFVFIRFFICACYIIFDIMWFWFNLSLWIHTFVKYKVVFLSVPINVRVSMSFSMCLSKMFFFLPIQSVNITWYKRL